MTDFPGDLIFSKPLNRKCCKKRHIRNQLVIRNTRCQFGWDWALQVFKLLAAFAARKVIAVMKLAEPYSRINLFGQNQQFSAVKFSVRKSGLLSATNVIKTKVNQ